MMDIRTEELAEQYKRSLDLHRPIDCLLDRLDENALIKSLHQDHDFNLHRASEAQQMRGDPLKVLSFG